MNKPVLLIFSLISLMTFNGCYPFFLFQSPLVLKPGEEAAVIGVAYMSNVYEPTLDTLGNENSFFADAAFMYRLGLGANTDAGAKVVGYPWRPTLLMLDLKQQLLRGKLNLAADLGLSFFGRGNGGFTLGYHPNLIAGLGDWTMHSQVNYLRGQDFLYITYDWGLAYSFYPAEGVRTLSPQFGLHLGHDNPENIYYSLAISFQSDFDL